MEYIEVSRSLTLDTKASQLESLEISWLLTRGIPISPTLKFYLIPVWPTLVFCAINCLLFMELW